jgi:hypothetical protein
MKTESPTYTVPRLLAEQKQVTEDARKTFGDLDVQQLNWKPNAQGWSIGQCVDHLINTNTPYFPAIEAIVNGEKSSTIWQKLPFFPGFFGRFIINAANPENARKVKVPPAFKPSSSAIDGEIVARFIASQLQLTELMKATLGMPLERIIITSPVASVITYSLMDAYTIMALHNRRHFNQAKRVMETHGFPKPVGAETATARASASI